MKRLVLKKEVDWHDYAGDVNRIVEICFKEGYDISFDDAYQAWRMYSESMAAGWMSLNHDDDYVFYSIQPYLDVQS